MSANRRQKKLRLQKWTIDSRDRDEGDSHNFKFRFPNGMRLATGGWARVTAVTLPMSYYTVRTGYNSIIPITGVVTTSVNIAQGYYSTPADLAAAVQTALQTADAGFACTYEEELQYFRFTHVDTAYTFTWASDASAGANAARLLGFPADADSVATGLVTISSQFPTFGEPYAFDVRSTALTRGTFSAIKTKLLGDRAIVRVPNSGTRGGRLNWASLEDSGRDLAPLQAPDGGVQLDEIDISIWSAGDDFEPQLLDLRGGDVIIELEIAGLE